MDRETIARWLPRLKRLAGTVALLGLIAGAAGYAAARMRPGPMQPIPFSHRVHAGMKEISCFFCHPDADRSPYPGMPQVEKCLLCHNVIIPEFRPILTLKEWRRRNKGVPWQRVNVLPDYVYFNHQIHLARGVDCGTCHGNVKEMDRIEKVNALNMGFCVNCHKARGATTDCWTCHR